ncbi:MAG: isochorismate synthase [Myxococcaceae bacterium]|nr:isochorismate synthase [Myxococcaceae bacterium]MCA3016048.1 isochorismate synthase [Myxococcaceae bacterium]
MLDRGATTYVSASRIASHGALLRLGPEPLSVAWVNPSRRTWVVGLGVCGEGGGEVRQDVELPAGPWFGGWAFDASRAWPGFDAERWVLPEVLAFWDGARTHLVAYGREGTPRAVLEARLDRVTEVEPVVERGRVTRQADDRQAYEGLVARGLEYLRSGGCSKLVLARALAVKGDAPLSERAVLKALEARNPTCWTFLVRGRDGSAFIGASPELLCEADGGNLTVDALAGTAALGDDAALERSEKDRREHQAVVDDVRARLDAFATRIEAPPRPVIKRLSTLVHLHTPVSARLRGGVSALAAARALHPTPAVAGAPRERALAFLAQHEAFSRGWYAGAVGAMGPARATFAVGLRSAHVKGATARLFVGAGVVEGSTPEGEWLETERKASTMLAALGVGHG